MTFPHKQKGWRKIVVDGETYRWHYTQPKEWIGLLMALGTQSGGQQLAVEINFLKWNLWENGVRTAAPGLKSITPKLAAEAIRFGLANGWNPELSGSPVRVEFKNHIFSLAAKSGSDI